MKDYIIKWISRKEIINNYLDQINRGIPLTDEQKQLIIDLSK